MVICKEDGPNDNQNKRDGAARIVANDHLDDPASYVGEQRGDDDEEDKVMMMRWLL